MEHEQHNVFLPEAKAPQTTSFVSSPTRLHEVAKTHVNFTGQGLAL
jgi:hypothetical protein